MIKYEKVSKYELLIILYWLVDGIDGYLSENNRLERYWKAEYVSRAREVIEYVRGELRKAQEKGSKD